MTEDPLVIQTYQPLMIIDGNNTLIRAHGGNSSANLTTSDGTPSGGLYNAIRMFHSYIAKFNPSHIAWFFDSGRSTFRTAINGDYKGNRRAYPKPGEDESYDLLIATFTHFQEYLDILGVKHHREYGVEADDWMAQMVVDHRDDLPIVMVTGDHDLRQLIRGASPFPVTVLKPSVGGVPGRRAVKEKLYTYDSVIEEYKLPPHRLPELWAIQGDSTDNIKGVPGMGPVRTLAALKEFGDLSGVISRHPKLAGYERVVHDNYRCIRLPHEEMGPVPFGLDDCKWDPSSLSSETMGQIQEFFYKWEMNSFLLKMTTTAGLWGKEEEKSEELKVGFKNI